MLNKVNKLADYFEVKLRKEAQTSQDYKKALERASEKMYDILSKDFPATVGGKRVLSLEKARASLTNPDFRIFRDIVRSEKVNAFGESLLSIFDSIKSLVETEITKEDVMQVREFVFDLTKEIHAYAGSRELGEDCFKSIEAFIGVKNNRDLTQEVKPIHNSISKSLNGLVRLLNANVIDNLDPFLKNFGELPKVNVGRQHDAPAGEAFRKTQVNNGSTNYARCLGIEPRLFGQLTKFLVAAGYSELAAEAESLVSKAVLKVDLESFISYDLEFKQLRSKIRKLVDSEELMRKTQFDRLRSDGFLKSESVVPRAYPTYEKLDRLEEQYKKLIESGKLDKDKGEDKLREIQDFRLKRTAEEARFDKAPYSKATLTTPEQKPDPLAREKHLDEIRHKETSEVLFLDEKFRKVQKAIDQLELKIAPLEDKKNKNVSDIAKLETYKREKDNLTISLVGIKEQLSKATEQKNKVHERVKEELSEIEEGDDYKAITGFDPDSI